MATNSDIHHHVRAAMRDPMTRLLDDGLRVHHRVRYPVYDDVDTVFHPISRVFRSQLQDQHDDH